MKFYRLYTGDDKQSHFDKLDNSSASGLFNTVHLAKGLVFQIENRPHLFDWHPAPRRQWVITLSGSVEIGLRDSEILSCALQRGNYIGILQASNHLTFLDLISLLHPEKN